MKDKLRSGQQVLWDYEAIKGNQHLENISATSPGPFYVISVVDRPGLNDIVRVSDSSKGSHKDRSFDSSLFLPA